MRIKNSAAGSTARLKKQHGWRGPLCLRRRAGCCTSRLFQNLPLKLLHHWQAPRLSHISQSGQRQHSLEPAAKPKTNARITNSEKMLCAREAMIAPLVRPRFHSARGPGSIQTSGSPSFHLAARVMFPAAASPAPFGPLRRPSG